MCNQPYDEEKRETVLLSQEGEALFFRKSLLTLESRHDFTMRDAILELPEFREVLEAFPSLDEIIKDRLTTVAQVTVLRPTLGAGLTSGEEQEGGKGGSISNVR